MTSSSSPLKILACGDIKGKWGPFVKRLETVNRKSGPFHMVIVVGSPFNPKNEDDDQTFQKLKEGKIRLPIPVYVLGPNSEEEMSYYSDLTGYEMVENCIYLGNQGCFTTHEGLKIAYLSGKQLTYDKLKEMEVKLKWNDPKFRGVDILMTSEWPKGITKYAGNPEATKSIDPNFEAQSIGSPIISKLALNLKPRYHFSGIYGVHYERLPYRNHKILSETTKHVTRFVALSHVANLEKKKWIYAFNITPMSSMDKDSLLIQPGDVTELPYNNENTSCDKVDEGNYSNSGGFFWDMNPTNDDKSRKRKHNDDRSHLNRRQPAQLLKPCWFCLSSPEVEKHLVVSVGDHAYLALPKGGLTDDHVLILPISHHASTLELPDDVMAEIAKFKKALKKSFRAQKKSVVFYERFYKCFHLQLQCVPVPKDVSDNVKRTFMEGGSASGVDLTEIPEHSNLSQMVETGTPYFMVETPNGESLYARVRSGFNINFGRDILANEQILDLPEKIDWRECTLSKDKETQLTKQFRELFKPYDFTLDEDN